jgi:hypothetical protein
MVKQREETLSWAKSQADSSLAWAKEKIRETSEWAEKQLNEQLERSQREITERDATIGALQVEVNDVRREIAGAIINGEPNPKIVDSLYKIIITMAKKGYAYDPTDQRSPQISEITKDAHELGLDIDAKTVRKHLRKAATLIGYEMPENKDD